MSPTYIRTSGKIPTKAQGQKQSIRGGEREETQNSEIHEANLAHTRYDTNDQEHLLL